MARDLSRALKAAVESGLSGDTMTPKRVLGAALLIVVLGGLKYLFDIVEKHKHSKK